MPTGLDQLKPGKIEFMPASGINAFIFCRFKPRFKPGGLNQLLTPIKKKKQFCVLFLF